MQPKTHGTDDLSLNYRSMIMSERHSAQIKTMTKCFLSDFLSRDAGEGGMRNLERITSTLSV